VLQAGAALRQSLRHHGVRVYALQRLRDRLLGTAPLRDDVTLGELAPRRRRRGGQARRGGSGHAWRAWAEGRVEEKAAR